MKLFQTCRCFFNRGKWLFLRQNSLTTWSRTWVLGAGSWIQTQTGAWDKWCYTALYWNCAVTTGQTLKINHTRFILTLLLHCTWFRNKRTKTKLIYLASTCTIYLRQMFYWQSGRFQMKVPVLTCEGFLKNVSVAVQLQWARERQSIVDSPLLGLWSNSSLTSRKAPKTARKSENTCRQQAGCVHIQSHNVTVRDD